MSTIPTRAGIQHGHISAPLKTPKVKEEKSPIKAIKDKPIVKSVDSADVRPTFSFPKFKKSNPIAEKIDSHVVNDTDSADAKNLKWHWGAFFLPVPWLIVHKFYGSAVIFMVTYLSLCCLIMPFASEFLPGQWVNLTFLISLGVPMSCTAYLAHKAALRKNPNLDIDKYISIQRKWNLAGFILAPLGALVGILLNLHH